VCLLQWFAAHRPNKCFTEIRNNKNREEKLLFLPFLCFFVSKKTNNVKCPTVGGRMFTRPFHSFQIRNYCFPGRVLKIEAFLFRFYSTERKIDWIQTGQDLIGWENKGNETRENYKQKRPVSLGTNGLFRSVFRK
jgi:hypothetical protein